MDKAEFDRRYGPRGYMQVIWVPHANAKFRKLKVSHRLVFAVLALLVSSFGLITLFSVMYLFQLRDDVYAHRASTEALERELTEANQRVSTSFHHLEVFTQRLIREQRLREQQVKELQARYDSLRPLTEGQERIAEAHRAILQQRTVQERVTEIGLGFGMGVLSSLLATVIWVAVRKTTTATPGDLDGDVDS